MDKTPPCRRDPDAWSRDTNRPGTSEHQLPEAVQHRNSEDTFRSQILCLTECPVRNECLRKAFEYGTEDDRSPALAPGETGYAYDNDFHVWAGYTGPERARLRDGSLNFPRPRRRQYDSALDRIENFISGVSIDSIAAEHGVMRRTLYNQLRNHIWVLRSDLGDHSSMCQTDSLCEERASVPAA